MTNQDIIVDQQKLYPVLPEVNTVVDNGGNFRLHKINASLEQLNNERTHYEHVLKKYNRA